MKEPHEQDVSPSTRQFISEIRRLLRRELNVTDKAVPQILYQYINNLQGGGGPYQKQTFFFSAVKQFFSTFISFDSPYTMLSSRGVTTFTWTFHHVFDKESYLCGICRTELLKLRK